MEQSSSQELNQIMGFLRDISNQTRILERESEVEGSRLSDLVSNFVRDFKVTAIYNEKRMTFLRIIGKEMKAMEEKVNSLTAQISEEMSDLRRDLDQNIYLLEDLQRFLINQNK